MLRAQAAHPARSAESPPLIADTLGSSRPPTPGTGNGLFLGS